MGNRIGRGRKKWICAMCDHTWFEPYGVLDRRTRLQCPGCGSYSVDLKTSEAKRDVKRNQGQAAANREDIKKKSGS